MSEATPGFKPKKSVALSGVVAGNTALCTVGRTGNDLHYRGYDILDIADELRVRGDRVPADPRQAAEPRGARGLQGEAEERCAACRPRCAPCSKQLPAASASDGRDAHRRVGARLRAAGEGRSQRRRRARHRRPADRVASARCWSTGITTATPASASTWRREDDSIGGHFLHLLHGERPDARLGARDAHLADPLRRARVQRLDVRRARHRRHRLGHVLGDRRRDRRAARPEARRRQRSRVRDPAALRDARRGRSGHPRARREQGSDHRLRPPGLHDLRPAQRGHQGRRAPAAPKAAATRRCSRSPSASRP